LALGGHWRTDLGSERSESNRLVHTEAVSDEEVRVSLAEGSHTPRGSNGATVSSTYGSNGTSKSLHNGATSNGVVASNGAVLPNGTSEQNTSRNGARRDYGTAAGKATAKQIQKELQPITTLEEVDGMDISIKPLDSCDAGQLEACAIERNEAKKQASLMEAAEAMEQTASKKEAPRTVKGTPYRGTSRWSKLLKVSTLQRSIQIWSFAFFFAIRYLLSTRKFTYGKKGMTPERVSERKTKLACWLRDGLIKLGPTFIKIGQQFSTRVDVLSPEFIKELEQLQDSVPAFDSKDAVAIIERDLGAPVATIYEEFESEPIAAASLGQVHLARLKGEQVVVKVQRPGLRQLFDIDLKNIRVLAQWLQAADPKSDGAARDWVAIYDECSRILYQEIDYRLEGENADRFRKNFGETPWIRVPRIFWDQTSSQVLTMEYTPGIKVNQVAQLDARGIDRKLLAKRAVESYLQQLLTYGFFHADPHPGNIAVDANTGGLIYYDFGMMGTIPSDVRSGLLELFYGVYQKDPDRCIEALITMGVLVPGGDRMAIRRTAEFFLKNFQDRLDQQKKEASENPDYGKDFKGQLSKDEKKAKRKQIIATIGEDLLVASADKPFRFPATFTFVVRSFTVLDGIGKSLDPRFDMTEIAAPYARNLLLEARPQFARLQKDLNARLGQQNRAIKNLFVSPNRIEDVALAMERIERGDVKLRVRALDSERALTRVMLQQKVMTAAVVASMLVNVGTVLSVSAMTVAASASFIAAGFTGFGVLANFVKLKNLERKEAQITGAV